MEFSDVRTVDYHTAGEPFRIVTDVPPLSGATVAEKRVFAMTDPATDGLRALLCSEPRGHAGMYGGFITEPDDEGAHFGVLFWHKNGFSTACGHGSIALGTWAIDSRLVEPSPTGVTDVVIDVPSGRVTARVHTAASGTVVSVDFVNIASYELHPKVDVAMPAGTVEARISFGGAIYAHVDVRTLGLRVATEHLGTLIDLSRAIKATLNPTAFARHPSDDRLDGIYGVVYYDDEGRDDEGNVVQRNVTIFADGEVDRSPCGSGTCSRIASLAATGELDESRVLVHRSIVGSTFVGTIIGRGETEGRPSVIPQVNGSAYKTGEHVFTVDPDDDLTPGFVLW